MCMSQFGYFFAGLFFSGADGGEHRVVGWEALECRSQEPRGRSATLGRARTRRDAPRAMVHVRMISRRLTVGGSIIVIKTEKSEVR